MVFLSGKSSNKRPSSSATVTSSAMSSRALEGAGAEAGARRHRYARASTASVTQLLSDSCSSLLHRLTRRVPSEKLDRNANLHAFKPKYEDLKVLRDKDDTVLTTVRRYENDRKYEEHPNFYSSAITRHKADEKTPLLPYTSSSKPRHEPASGGSSLMRSRTEDIRPLLSTFSTHKTRPSPPVLSASRQPLNTIRETDTNREHHKSPALGTTRSRLEDKYSAILDKVAHRKKEREKKENEDRDRTIEPSIPKNLVRSLTTAVFGEKSYSYASSVTSRDKTRDKTPFKYFEKRTSSTRRKARPLEAFDEAASSRGKDRDSIYRTKTKIDGCRSLRNGRSENSDRLKHLKLCDVDIGEGPSSLSQSSSCASISTGPQRQQLAYHDDDESTPTADPALLEREAKRKEIQSLILKYAALDEVYGRMEPLSAAAKPAVTSLSQTAATSTALVPVPQQQALAHPSQPAARPSPRAKHVNAATPPRSFPEPSPLL